jgi:hypothetical protein
MRPSRPTITSHNCRASRARVSSSASRAAWASSTICCQRSVRLVSRPSGDISRADASDAVTGTAEPASMRWGKNIVGDDRWSTFSGWTNVASPVTWRSSSSCVVSRIPATVAFVCAERMRAK